MKPTTVQKDKERYHIMIKGSIQQENLTILNIYTPNIGAPRLIKRVLLHSQQNLDNYTIIMRDINTALTIFDRYSRQKTNKLWT